jgi:hypothetical protein
MHRHEQHGSGYGVHAESDRNEYGQSNLAAEAWHGSNQDSCERRDCYQLQ